MRDGDEKVKCYSPEQVLDAITSGRLMLKDPATPDSTRLRLISALDGFDTAVDQVLRAEGDWCPPSGSPEDW